MGACHGCREVQDVSHPLPSGARELLGLSRLDWAGGGDSGAIKKPHCSKKLIYLISDSRRDMITDNVGSLRKITCI